MGCPTRRYLEVSLVVDHCVGLQRLWLEHLRPSAERSGVMVAGDNTVRARPSKDTKKVINALIKQAHKLPRELYKSLSWDHGKEDRTKTPMDSCDSTS